MKLFLQPSRYTAHRIACIALYRALLEQCPRVQHLAEGWPATPLTFKHLIRKQFRRNQYVQHSRLVVAALKAGYEAEELLRHAGDGNEIAKSKVMAILHDIETTRTLSRANAAIPPGGHEKRRLPAPYPGTKPVLESRPRPQEELGGSGIRKAPVFVNAGGLPMLRFSKMHSPFLSRVLNQLEAKKVVRFERIEALEGMYKMGVDEDQWDWLIRDVMREEGRSDDDGDDRSSWCDVLGEQTRMDKGALTESHRKSKEMAKRMLEIVSQEEELVARERYARRRERKRERKMEGHDGEDEKPPPRTKKRSVYSK